MIHDQRHFAVKTYDSLASIADALFHPNFTTCAGLLFDGALFLNDSFSECGAQEFAGFVQNDQGQWTQVESITFSWTESLEETQRYIQDVLNYKGAIEKAPIQKVFPVNLDHPTGTCHLCH